MSITAIPSTSTPSHDPVPPGRYRHFKGREYEVLGVARHSETEEPLVIYRCLYGDGGLWVRPLPMFLESVSIGGESVERFSYLGPMDAPGQMDADGADHA